MKKKWVCENNFGCAMFLWEVTVIGHQLSAFTLAWNSKALAHANVHMRLYLETTWNSFSRKKTYLLIFPFDGFWLYQCPQYNFGSSWSRSSLWYCLQGTAVILSSGGRHSLQEVDSQASGGMVRGVGGCTFLVHRSSQKLPGQWRNTSGVCVFVRVCAHVRALVYFCVYAKNLFSKKKKLRSTLKFLFSQSVILL